MQKARKVLLLSIGYGRGHHSAAISLAQELRNRGYDVHIQDPCAQASPRLFHLTQLFYRECVRRMPWVWGIAYNQIDGTDWSMMLATPGIAATMRMLRTQLREQQPDLIVCTYPLYAYMLDAFADEGWLRSPYAVVVTDALHVNSAWVLSHAPLVCMPDEQSCHETRTRFSLPEERLRATGFPVRKEFHPGKKDPVPGPRGGGLRVVYGAHGSMHRIKADVEGMLRLFPEMHLTLLAEDREDQIRRVLGEKTASQLHFFGSEGEDLSNVLNNAHLYIGKAGASTVFEAYCAETPVLVNYILPGQEEGNMQLLLRDGAGKRVEGTGELLRVMHGLLSNRSAGLKRMQVAMRRASRNGGAASTADALEARFFPSRTP